MTERPLTEMPGWLLHLPSEAHNPAKEMKFLKNYNMKFFCRYFTSIRLDSDKWQPGEYYKIIHKGEYSFRGLIIDKKPVLLSQIPPFTLAIDTGLPVKEAREFLTAIYKDYDLTKQNLAVLLIENLEWIP